MIREATLELLRRQPFEPFEIRLASGEKYKVRRPEMALVQRSRVIVTVPNSDRMVLIPLLHIASIETLQSF